VRQIDQLRHASVLRTKNAIEKSARRDERAEQGGNHRLS
jgi:hypothetical protein